MDITQTQKQIDKLSIILKIGAPYTKWKKLAGRTKDRYYRFRQLVTTQQDYQKDLKRIRSDIQTPLIKQGIITDKDASIMFPNVQSMIGLSEQLKQQLNAKFDKWDRRTTMIGQTMIRFCKFLLVYSDYFKNFNDTQLKIKQLLANNAKARQIQKLLSTEKRIITFIDLIAKPFQRPLKYHLILRDYASKVDKSHPDYKFLQQAIQHYHKINQKNNTSLQDKQKGQILMILDQRFGNIIQSQARYFVKQTECTIIDTLYSMFILSDVIIFALKNSNKESYRVYVNKYSYIEHAKDGHYFINRLYLYGKYNALHLTFFDSQVCENIYQIIKNLIDDTSVNQTRREEIINQRNTRMSMIQRRRSYTNLEPQFKRPLVVKVLGCEKRYVCQDKQKTKYYYILQFQATPPNLTTCPHQISYVTIQQLLYLEFIGTMLYKNESSLGVFPLLSRPSGVTQSEYKKNEDRRIQIQTIYIQLFLNTLFRNQKVLKRIDFVTHKLKLCEPLWIFLNENYAEDYFNYKNQPNRKPIKHYLQYFDIQRQRYLNYSIKDSKAIFRKAKGFSDIKTIVNQEQYSLLPAKQFLSSDNNQTPRLIWLKSKLGWINHTMTTPKPMTTKIDNLCVHLCHVDGSQPYYIQAFTSYRVRHILDLLSKRLNIPLEDYTISAQINGTNYLLFEDQLIYQLFAKEKQPEGFFKSLFKSQQYPIKLYLKKIWSLQRKIQLKQNPAKINLQVEQIIYRLKNQQMKLPYEINIAVYAYYYAFKHFIEFDTITLNKLKMKTEYFSKIIAPSMKNSKDYIDNIYMVIEGLKKQKNIASASVLAERIVQIACDKLGWRSFLYDAYNKTSLLRQSNGSYSQSQYVKIGCDIQGIHILLRDRLTIKQTFTFQNKSWHCHINGFELTIKRNNEEFNYIGRDLWKVKKQVDLYKLYRREFTS